MKLDIKNKVCYFDFLQKNRTVCPIDDDTRTYRGGRWRLCIEIDLLLHACSDETNYRENAFGETIKIQGSKFVLTHDDDAIFLRLYRYALDELTLILRPLIASIEFPAIFGNNTRTYCTVDSSELSRNVLFAFAGLVEKFLVMNIVSAWYKRRNLMELSNECSMEKKEAEGGIRNLLDGSFARLRLDDLNLGIGGSI